MDFLQVSGISKNGEKDFILKAITFNQVKGRKIAIAGETGSGKSTLLKIIAGIASPNLGEVWFENKRVKKIPEEKLVPGHPGIAYLSQYFELPKSLTVNQVLIYANSLADNEAEADTSAQQLYDTCRISHLLHRKTDQLSGGEKQRVALAKALISAPRLLLLDEPFSNLDLIHKNILKTVIHDIGEKLGITCILISHDPLDTLSWADEIIVMKDGEVVQQALPIDIYLRPANEYVAGLFGKYLLVSTSQEKAFAHIHTIKKEQTHIRIVRPENLRINAGVEDAIQGKVKRTSFFGSYYEVEVMLQNETIAIKVDKAGFKTGETVFVSLAD